MHLAAYVRYLKTKNRSDRTVQSYSETLLLLSEFYGGADVTELDREQIENFMIDQLQRHKATSAGVRFRNLRAFYNWCVEEEVIDLSPMRRMSEPKPTDEPPPVLNDDDLKALLKACSGKEFDDRRDTAIIRLWCEPGSPRVSEMAGVLVDDVDMRGDKVTIRGKGDKIRTVPFGAKTGQALDRYLRLRVRHPDADSPRLWLGGRRRRVDARRSVVIPLTASGLTQMLTRRAQQAGIGHVHPHQLRHTAAHVFADSGASDGDAMALFGWSSSEMPRRYGRSAKTERAHRTARRLSLGDRL